LSQLFDKATAFGFFDSQCKQRTRSETRFVQEHSSNIYIHVCFVDKNRAEEQHNIMAQEQTAYIEV